ncbi:hypothetical protein ACFTZB_04030 [Rhodococcus sp. NPDC057014]|uniref:hypothetical protein n=1 Tax=Rhodococcus sp. NPDC057014 TaxID=3346000 RepID=UPI00362DD8B9
MEHTATTLPGVVFCPIGHTLYLGDAAIIDTHAEADDDRSLASGLVMSSGERVFVNTGIESGLVSLMIAAHRGWPGPAERQGWEDVAEISFVSSSSLLSVLYFTSLDNGPKSRHTVPLARAVGGEYRARVCARGRDLFFGLKVDDPVEKYVIYVWPEPWSEPLLIKRSTNFRFFGRAEGIPWAEGGT